MDGPTALEYVRSRHADLIGDFGRGARQMQMLLAIRQKADSLGITNIGEIQSLVDELHGLVQSGIGMGMVFPMAGFAHNLKLSQIHRIVLSPPRYSSIGTAPDGESVVYADWTAIAPVVQRMFAPPSSVQVVHHHVPPPPMTAELATAMVSRVVGATVVPKHPPPEPKPVAPASLKGRIFYVQNGNIWAFNKGYFYPVTHSSAISDPSFTPNGKTFVYARRWSPVVSDIFLKHRNSGKVLQLTQDKTTDGNVWDNVWAFSPAISPDGNTVVYSSDAYKLTCPGACNIDLALYVYNRETGTTTQVSTPDAGAGGDVDARFDPANPNRVLYTDFYYLPDESVASRLMVLNLATDTSVPVSPYGTRMSQGAWQPNGHHLAYIKSGSIGTGLYIAPYFRGWLWTGRPGRSTPVWCPSPLTRPTGRTSSTSKRPATTSRCGP